MPDSSLPGLQRRAPPLPSPPCSLSIRMVSLVQGRLGVVQRIVPHYRARFFDELAQRCSDGLEVFAGQPRPGEPVGVSTDLGAGRLTIARNRYGQGGDSYVCWQGSLGRWLQRWDPQLLVLEGNPRLLSHAIAFRWAHARGRPVIGWSRSSDAAHGGGIRGGMRKLWVRQFDGMIAYGNAALEQFTAEGLPRERLFVAQNATVRLPEQPRTREYANTSQPLKLLFVGRLIRDKRVDLLLRACGSVATASSALTLTVMGDGDEREGLESLASRVFPAARFTGALYGQDAAKEFDAADLLVIPAHGGLAIQEGLAHGLPVIVGGRSAETILGAGDPAAVELVDDSVGWLIEPNDPSALTDALCAALGDRGALGDMSRAARRRVATRANVDLMVEQFVAAIRTVGHLPRAP